MLPSAFWWVARVLLGSSGEVPHEPLRRGRRDMHHFALVVTGEKVPSTAANNEDMFPIAIGDRVGRAAGRPAGGIEAPTWEWRDAPLGAEGRWRDAHLSLERSGEMSVLDTVRGGEMSPLAPAVRGEISSWAPVMGGEVSPLGFVGCRGRECFIACGRGESRPTWTRC